MDHAAFLRYLCERYVLPDIEAGRVHERDDFASGYYRERLGILEPEDWQRVYAIVAEKRRPRDGRAEADAALCARLVEECSEMPPVARIAEVLGQDEATRCLELAEEMEDLPSAARVEFAVAPTGKKARWSPKEVARAVDLLGLLAGAAYGGAHEVAEAYRQYEAGRRERRRQKRACLRQKNEGLRKRARCLGMWFPRNLEEWRHDARTSDAYEEFSRLLSQTRARLQRPPDRGLLQYVPKRCLTSSTVADLPLNMEHMRRYCRTRRAGGAPAEAAGAVAGPEVREAWTCRAAPSLPHHTGYGQGFHRTGPASAAFRAAPPPS